MNRERPAWRWYDSVAAIALWLACVAFGLVVGLWLLEVLL